MKSHLIIISTVAVVLLISAGVAYPVLSNPSPTEPPPQVIAITEQPAPPRESKPSPEQPVPPGESKPPSEQPPLTFEQKVEYLKKAIDAVCATGESKEVTIVFSETEANNQAAKLLAQAEIPEDIPLEIEGVHIDFQSDNNVLTEARSVIYNRNKVTIKIKTQVGIVEGKP